MSVSKLESLPNELLLDILGKYINGLDVLAAFRGQQNQRFNALIAQCQRLRFDFRNCRKDNFHFCLALLPPNIQYIEKLVLSEHNTPGQIHAFFSVFPSFASFNRLRKLNLHFDAKAIEWQMIETAIRSLSNTIIDTLSIEVINTDKIFSIYSFIADIFRLSTLKRLTIKTDPLSITRDFLRNISSNIEYLTIAGVCFEFQHLQAIFRCTSHLKYLDVRLTGATHFNFFTSTTDRKIDVTPMPTLNTLILSFQKSDPTTFNMLAQCLTAMPALRSLEIKAHKKLLEASTWETLLQTAVPLLTHFTLRTTTSCIENADIDDILSSFETRFWIEKENFYMIITKHLQLDLNTVDRENMQAIYYYEYDLPVTQWWTVPMRTRIDDMPLDRITSLGISGVASSLCLYNYFTNINHLAIYNLDEDLLEWIKTYVNYSRIKYLDISLLKNESSIITSLLSCTQNIRSLRIQYDRLVAHQNVYLERENYLKHLDISAELHRFDEQDIITISKLFPNIEHLEINTTHLSNVPLLQTYLPQLRSLIFKIMDSRFHYRQRLWDDHLREIDTVSFQPESDRMTVWIDKDALKERYWKQIPLNSSRSVNKPTVTKGWKRIFSYFE